MEMARYQSAPAVYDAKKFNRSSSASPVVGVEGVVVDARAGKEDEHRERQRFYDNSYIGHDNNNNEPFTREEDPNQERKDLEERPVTVTSPKRKSTSPTAQMQVGDQRQRDPDRFRIASPNPVNSSMTTPAYESGFEVPKGSSPDKNVTNVPHDAQLPPAAIHPERSSQNEKRLGNTPEEPLETSSLLNRDS